MTAAGFIPSNYFLSTINDPKLLKQPTSKTRASIKDYRRLKENSFEPIIKPKTMGKMTIENENEKTLPPFIKFQPCSYALGL